MRSFENLVGNAMQKAEGRTLESTDKMRIAFAEVIESATKRFARRPRTCARPPAAIRAELEETRAEIKKGVFELPMEAKESTTAIRRAVSEQINALKELSEIVAKSGRNNDVSAARQAAPAPRPAAPRPAAAGRAPSGGSAAATGPGAAAQTPRRRTPRSRPRPLPVPAR